MKIIGTATRFAVVLLLLLASQASRADDAAALERDANLFVPSGLRLLYFSDDDKARAESKTIAAWTALATGKDEAAATVAAETVHKICKVQSGGDSYHSEEEMLLLAKSCCSMLKSKYTEVRLHGAVSLRFVGRWKRNARFEVIENKEVIDALTAATKDRDERVRDAAVESLKSIRM